MILKIEKLSEDAKVVFIRNGKQQKASVGTSIYDDEIATLVVETGTVVYSINEQELVTKSAEVAEVISEPVPEPAPAVVAPTPAPAPAKKIIYPGKKK